MSRAPLAGPTAGRSPAPQGDNRRGDRPSRARSRGVLPAGPPRPAYGRTGGRSIRRWESSRCSPTPLP